jgi:hypothetical protein
MGSAVRLPLLLDTLRGGTWGVAVDRDAAKDVVEVWPRAPRMIGWLDRFSSAAAEDAVLRSMTTVVFGGAGFPHGEPPHAAAARASRTAAFRYCAAASAIAGQIGRSFSGDRVTAHTASVSAPREMLRTAGLLSPRGKWRGGPVHLQWGLDGALMERGEMAKLAAEYRELLPSGSELAIAVPVGPEGVWLSMLAGGRPQSARDLADCCTEAGLDLAGPVADVRAYGRGALGGGLRGDGGRIVAAIARVP